jgi:type IV fimbrial biogenesis protein FimT
MSRRRESGFNILEIMAVIMIVGILAAFAFPAMTDLLRTQKVRSAAYDLFADLTFARGEAIARGRDVTMTSTSGNNWLDGWMIVDTGTGAVLRQHGQGAAGITFTADAGQVTFERNGRTAAGRVSFSISPVDTSAPANQKRCVRIDPSGRAVSSDGVCT